MTDDRNPINPNADADAGSALGPVDPLDERLSAELDGVAAAGMSPAEPARTDDEGLVVERRRELAAARDLLAIPPPPLDDVTRRRLVRAALSEAPPARRSHDRNLLRSVGVAAAVLAVLVVGGVTLKAVTDSDGVYHTASRTGDKSASAVTSTTSAGNGTQLRELSDPLVLKKTVLRALRDQSPSTTTAPQPTEERSQSDTFSRAVPLDNCDATVRLPAGVTPTVLGRGTFKGAPAVVLVAHDGGRTLIFVVATADCRLLTSQFFGE